ncbi:hypothetical protein AQI94_20545 [Streptomyces pseudovenezuelae]|uniref:Methyltransferase n=1 Tax=Streptomyces pseudovenezuelae TaxID=67350 RepID=A0A101N4P7_9ACTN|nr:hypothetical protein AQI94_20545 [Streptomyces pseudovenezuelae]
MPGTRYHFLRAFKEAFFGPAEILALARASGFREARHVPVEELDRRYFRGRTDGVRPSRGEELMLAST